MPTSIEKGSGFSVSKWELNYLKCRFRAHRNKIAAAKPAIDCTSPPERPHVLFKHKKALMERRRQAKVVQENLRILNKTAEIMSSSDTSQPRHSAKICSNSRRALCARHITTVMKRNSHILLQWFLHKFGKYIPWWAEINYA